MAAVEDQVLVQAFARLKPVALGVAFGSVKGFLLALATAILLIEGPSPGSAGEVGGHLKLLAHYFPGYSVTPLGALLGLGYGFLSGFVLGVALATLVNLNHAIYLRLLARKLRSREITDAL
jgi:hypothetical protein